MLFCLMSQIQNDLIRSILNRLDYNCILSKVTSFSEILISFAIGQLIFSLYLILCFLSEIYQSSFAPTISVSIKFWKSGLNHLSVSICLHVSLMVPLLRYVSSIAPNLPIHYHQVYFFYASHMHGNISTIYKMSVHPPGIGLFHYLSLFVSMGLLLHALPS